MSAAVATKSLDHAIRLFWEDGPLDDPNTLRHSLRDIFKDALIRERVCKHWSTFVRSRRATSDDRKEFAALLARIPLTERIESLVDSLNRVKRPSECASIRAWYAQVKRTFNQHAVTYPPELGRDLPDDDWPGVLLGWARENDAAPDDCYFALHYDTETLQWRIRDRAWLAAEFSEPEDETSKVIAFPDPAHYESEAPA